MTGRITELFTAPLLDLVYPPGCVGCNGQVSHSFHLLCEDCVKAVPWLSEAGCQRCGSELVDDKFCRLCEGLDHCLTFVRSAAWFGGCVPDLIHTLKYTGRKEIAGLLAELALASISLNHLPEKPDMLLAVPLHWRRRLNRGFNQSQLLAAKLSELLAIPLAGPKVVRVKPTATQTRLNPEQRKKNVAGAFHCRSNTDLDGAAILVIDDVMTTGATLGEVASSLTDAGARCVFGWTFARA